MVEQRRRGSGVALFGPNMLAVERLDVIVIELCACGHLTQCHRGARGDARLSTHSTVVFCLRTRRHIYARNVGSSKCGREDTCYGAVSCFLLPATSTLERAGLENHKLPYPRYTCDTHPRPSCRMSHRHRLNAHGHARHIPYSDTHVNHMLIPYRLSTTRKSK